VIENGGSHALRNWATLTVTVRHMAWIDCKQCQPRDKKMALPTRSRIRVMATGSGRWIPGSRNSAGHLPCATDPAGLEPIKLRTASVLLLLEFAALSDVAQLHCFSSANPGDQDLSHMRRLDSPVFRANNWGQGKNQQSGSG